MLRSPGRTLTEIAPKFTAMAIGPDGAAYVTNFGIVPGKIPGAFPDGGQVLRIELY